MQRGVFSGSQTPPSHRTSITSRTPRTPRSGNLEVATTSPERASPRRDAPDYLPISSSHSPAPRSSPRRSSPRGSSPRRSLSRSSSRSSSRPSKRMKKTSPNRSGDGEKSVSEEEVLYELDDDELEEALRESFKTPQRRSALRKRGETKPKPKLTHPLTFGDVTTYKWVRDRDSNQHSIRTSVRSLDDQSVAEKEEEEEAQGTTSSLSSTSSSSPSKPTPFEIRGRNNQEADPPPPWKTFGERDPSPPWKKSYKYRK